MANTRNRTPLGLHLRSLREGEGLSRATLAARSGVSEPTIANIELYGQIPRLETLADLARALGVSVASILASGDGDAAA